MKTSKFHNSTFTSNEIYRNVINVSGNNGDANKNDKSMSMEMDGNNGVGDGDSDIGGEI